MKVLQWKPEPDHMSSCQVMFIFQPAPSPPPELPGLAVSPLQVRTGSTKFDLSLFMADSEQGLKGTLTYKADLFDAATITGMLEHFQILLECIVATGDSLDQPLSGLPCLTKAERQNLIARRDDGQVDHAEAAGHTLPTLDQARSESGEAFVGPRNDLELQLVMIWEEVLGIRPIGVRDSFFDLGGHSLSLARLFARIERAHDKHLAPTTFFRAPTVEQLASMLSEKEPAASHSLQVKIRPGVSKRLKDTFWIGLKNRFLQAIALYSPGAKRTRVWLHRMRGVKIGNNVFIGIAVIIESAYPRLVSIGDNVVIGVRSAIIAHFAGTARKAKYDNEPSVRIEDNVYIGPGVIILPNVTIGQGAVVAAGSVVNSSVPPLTMVRGNPAEPVARCGVPLAGGSYGKFIRNLRPIKD
jgi:acetyltransferase-like isoleucine patch superfamily enzyme/acyl carrier protein